MKNSINEKEMREAWVEQDMIFDWVPILEINRKQKVNTSEEHQ